MTVPTTVRPDSVPGPQTARRNRWSLARQLVVLQVAVVVLALGGATVLAGVDADKQVQEQAGRRCLAVASVIADMPAIAAAIGDADPSATLQPIAVKVQQDTGTDFVTIMDPDGIRWTHRDPAQIGKPFLGSRAEALAGGTIVETYTGTLGESIRAVVPIRSAVGGPVIGLVSVGVTLAAVGDESASQLGDLLLGAALVLLVALLGTWLIGRRVDRLTHRMGPAELGLMYEHYDAVLHSVREGLLLLDDAGRVRLLNNEARRLLDLPDGAVGQPIDALGLPTELASALASGEDLLDALHLAADGVVVVNSVPATNQAGSHGRVVTLRDHTELTALTSELGVAKDLTEALRSQAHESANRLHAVISLVELGRSPEAISFATEELRLAQVLTDQVVAAVQDPLIAAVLLGKSATAAERGIELEITADSGLDEHVLSDAELPARDVATVLGNLLDNAFEAVGGNPGGRPRQVSVTVRRSTPVSDQLLIRVSDSGPGLQMADPETVFVRGFSTKAPDGTVHGHGLGLALVRQVAQRHHGDVQIGPVVEDAASLSGATFTVLLGGPGRQDRR